MVATCTWPLAVTWRPAPPRPQLPEVRQLLLAGSYQEGTRRGNEAFGGGGGTSGAPNRVDPYQPAGDLCFELTHGEVSEYRRELDLASGLVRIAYAADGSRFRREYLAHLAHDLILVHLAADRPFGGSFWLQRIEDADCFLHFDTSPAGSASGWRRVCRWRAVPAGSMGIAWSSRM